MLICAVAGVLGAPESDEGGSPALPEHLQPARLPLRKAAEDGLPSQKRSHFTKAAVAGVLVSPDNLSHFSNASGGHRPRLQTSPGCDGTGPKIRPRLTSEKPAKTETKETLQTYLSSRPMNRKLRLFMYGNK